MIPTRSGIKLKRFHIWRSVSLSKIAFKLFILRKALSAIFMLACDPLGSCVTPWWVFWLRPDAPCHTGMGVSR